MNDDVDDEGDVQEVEEQHQDEPAEAQGPPLLFPSPPSSGPPPALIVSGRRMVYRWRRCCCRKWSRARRNAPAEETPPGWPGSCADSPSSVCAAGAPRACRPCGLPCSTAGRPSAECAGACLRRLARTLEN